MQVEILEGSYVTGCTYGINICFVMLGNMNFEYKEGRGWEGKKSREIVGK